MYYIRNCKFFLKCSIQFFYSNILVLFSLYYILSFFLIFSYYIFIFIIFYIFFPHIGAVVKKAFHCVAHYVWLGMRQIQNLIGFEMYNHGMTGLPSDTAPHSLARPAGNLHAESSNKNRTNKKKEVVRSTFL